MEPYQYQPIDLAKDAIRVLKLVHGHETEPIECDLVESLLGEEQGIPYQALSYTWGTSTNNQTVKLCGIKKRVTENLHSALLHLRKPNEDVWLWVDALCIDQENHREKTHQVGHMRRIYEKADHVLIWLGLGTRETSILMDAMAELHTLARDHGDYQRHNPRAWEKAWPLMVGEAQPGFQSICQNALKNMLARPWFRRVWILQEVFSARAATMLCGTKAISTETFVIMSKLLHVTPEPYVQAVLDIMPGYLRRESWRSKEPDLLTLLQRFDASEATEARDKIYALLGISSDIRVNGLLRPDYSISLRDAIQGVVWYLITGENPETRTCPLPNWDFDQFSNCLETPHKHVLTWSLEHEQYATLMEMLEKGVSSHINIDEPLTEMGTMLQSLASRSPPEHVVTFVLGYLEHIADISKTWDRKDESGNTPIRTAARRGNAAVVRALLAHPGFHLDPGDSISLHFNSKRRSLLAEAAENGHFAVVESLMSARAKTTSPESPPNEALDYDAIGLARKQGHTSIVNLLLNRGSRNAADPQSWHGRRRSPPLLEAIYSEQVDDVKLLLEAGADYMERSSAGLTPLGIAAWMGNEAIVRLLLDNHRKVSTTSDELANFEFLECMDPFERVTPLWVAAEKGLSGVVRDLISAGADVTTTGGHRTGHSALGISILNGHDEVAHLLIGSGARLVDFDRGWVLSSERRVSLGTDQVQSRSGTQEFSNLLLDAGMSKYEVNAEFRAAGLDKPYEEVEDDFGLPSILFSSV